MCYISKILAASAQLKPQDLADLSLKFIVMAHCFDLFFPLDSRREILFAQNVILRYASLELRTRIEIT